MSTHKTILFSGGGTLGSVTPLLAVCDTLKKKRPNTRVIWIGTQTGPERALVEGEGIPFYPITSGKLRRYASIQNIIDVFRTATATFRSLLLLSKERPDLCVTAGGYISVPIHAAAWLLRIPTWVHQQDIEIGLANKIMGRYATMVTTALKEQTKAFPKAKKTRWLGNPVRRRTCCGDIERARKQFNISSKKPVVFVMGGGTGAAQVNDLVVDVLPLLDGVCSVLHLYGKERQRTAVQQAEREFEFYHPYAFFTDEMKDAYALADIVVSRAGFGALSELAALKKPVILIPKEGHQEKNAAYFEERGGVIALYGEAASPGKLEDALRQLLKKKKQTEALGAALHEALPVPSARKILHVIDTCTK